MDTSGDNECYEHNGIKFQLVRRTWSKKDPNKEKIYVLCPVCDDECNFKSEIIKCDLCGVMGCYSNGCVGYCALISEEICDYCLNRIKEGIKRNNYFLP